MGNKKVLSALLGITFSLVASVGYARPAADKALASAPGGFARLADADYTAKGQFVPSLGNWFDFDNPGWGFDIQQVGNLLFVIWFTYLPDGTPVWYLAVGELDGMSWTADLEFYKWDRFGAPGSQATVAIVGTISMEWSDENNASVTWTLNANPGGADISFAEFAPGPMLANLTGHYFPAFAPGWGVTFLTQGEVTVVTMYFYKDGQPTWVQGVVTDPGLFGVADMNVFFGPGLCPSCLGKRGDNKANVDSEFSVSVGYQYAPGFSSNAGLTEQDVNPNSSLGSNPFGDLPLSFVPQTVTTITGAYQNGLMAILERPPLQMDCVEFRYRLNLMTDPMPIGLSESHWFMADIDANGNMPVYNDENCTQRNQLQSAFNGQMYDSWVQGALTNKITPMLKGTQFKWVTVVPNAFEFGLESCDLEEGLAGYGSAELVQDGDDVDLFVNLTGIVGFELQHCTDLFQFLEYRYVQEEVPSNEDALDNWEDSYLIRFQYQLAL